MSDNEVTSGNNSDVSNTEDKDASGANDDKVAYSTYKKAIGELKNTKSELQELREWRARVEEEKLLKENEKDKVIELKNQKISTLETELNGLKERDVNAKKISSIFSELKKMGFDDAIEKREAAMRLIDTREVHVDPTTGVIMGSDEVAKVFKERYQSLGFFKKETPGVNQNAPSYNTNEISRKSYIDALKAAKTQTEFDKIMKEHGRV